MSRPNEAKFDTLCEQVMAREPATHPGKMMSSPALQYDGKVFFFLNRRGFLVYKLGAESELPTDAKPKLEPFSPFKSKAPLKGWWELTDEQPPPALAMNLAQEALACLKRSL